MKIKPFTPEAAEVPVATLEVTQDELELITSLWGQLSIGKSNQAGIETSMTWAALRKLAGSPRPGGIRLCVRNNDIYAERS